MGLDFDLTSSLVALNYFYSKEGYPYPDFITASWSGSGTFLVTPLPAALPLFGTGLGMMGLLGWRRKRKAALGFHVPTSASANAIQPFHAPPKATEMDD